jgi:HPt (histidine-containing phosphotransfer) domain-containing protein
MMHENKTEPRTCLDVEKLEKQFSGKPRLLDVMKQEFASLQETLLPELQNAYAQGNLQSLKDLAHTLKGNAALIGAVEVQELARTIEIAARDANRDDLQAKTEQLPASFQQALEQLENVRVSFASGKADT